MTRFIIPAIAILAMMSLADAQPMVPSGGGGGGGGSSTITANSTATSGCVAGAVLNSDGSLVQCSKTLPTGLTIPGYAPLASPTFTGVVTTAVGTSANPALAIGNATTGLYSVSTTGFGISINGVLKGDYGVTSGNTWYFLGNTAVSALLLGSPATSFSITPVDTANTLQLGSNSNSFSYLNIPNSAQFQFGKANAASPVAQTLSFQGGAGVTVNGVNATIIGSLSTNTGTSGDIIVQTGKNGNGSGVLATATTALTIKGETQAVLTAGTLTVGTVNSATGLFVCETAGLLSSGITTCVASDRAVKHDITAIDDINLLDKVLDQRGVRFTYNEAKGAPGRRIGVIANDWEKSFPELVDYDTDGIRHFDYAATWGLTVELVRKLHSDNDNLRAEVDALRRSISR